ncbi:MAG: beta-propeller domain-containing protein [Actinomycetota bacterium]
MTVSVRSVPIRSKFVPALLGLTLVAAACTDSITTGSAESKPAVLDNTELSSDDILLTSGLRTVDTCDALLERIKDEAVERVGPYGFDHGGYFGGPIFLEEDAMEFAEDEEAMVDESFSADTAESATTTQASRASADGAALAGDGDDSGSFSETNNQEQGVDEADLVKTDGRRLVVVNGEIVRVIDVTGDTPRLTSTIRLPDGLWAGELFLDGDRALIMSSGWTEKPFAADRSIPTDWYPGSPVGVLAELDLVEGEITRTFEFEGNYVSAREIDGTIRIVLSAAESRFAFVYPSNDNALDSAEAANRAVIEESTIEQWIPTARLTVDGEVVSEGPIVDCDQVHLPTEFAGFGSLVMLTASLDGGLSINDAISVYTDAQTIYASTDRLAVATPRWPTYDEDGQPDRETFTTALHTFDITDPSRAQYVASGSVRGHLLNQFSMSEHEGYLRVATTDGSPWWGGGSESESYVTVFDETDDGVLRQVGQVGGLGPGETIHSARFLGDWGYVVTFRQIDPLFTIDLSDPTNPRVTGELKIPGVSNYLHPIDESHLLGVGADGDLEGRLTGAAVSLFNIGDPNRPAEEDKLVILPIPEGSEGDSSSPVSWDAKAFTYYNDIALVPVSWWTWNPDEGTESNGSAVYLVRVNPDADGEGSLTELGRVSHPRTRECDGVVIFEEEVETVEPSTEEEPTDAEASFVDGDDPAEEEPAVLRPAPGEFCWEYQPEIQRSVVINDNLYTISYEGVQVNAFDGLEQITWIPFER